MRIFVFIFILAMIGCTDQNKITELQETQQKLQMEKDLLEEQSKLKDGYIEEYTKTVNDVYDYLEKIRKREGLLMRYSQELEGDKTVEMREKIMTNLTSIDTYIANSRKEITRLRNNMSDSEVKYLELEKTIENLSTLINEKEAEIASLRSEISQLTELVAETESKLREKAELAAVQEQRLNTAYYIIGNDSDLREKNIIDKRGGILGLGRTTTLAEDIDNAYFTPADITETDSIRIASEMKAVKIISSHDPDSYHMTEQADNHTVLEIINPESFWKMKYLVILAKN